MKLNRGGLILCSVYAACAVPLLVLRYVYFDTNPKGAFVAGQLSGIPLALFVTVVRLTSFVIEHPWLNNVYVFFVLNLVFLYLIALGTGALSRWLQTRNRA